MNKYLLFSIVVGATGGVHAQNIERLDKTIITANQLDSGIARLTAAANVAGLSVTVFNHNEPVYHKNFGFANIEKKVPISAATNIYGASLSKALFATIVMKLVEQKILDLDKPLQSYLPKKVYEYTPQTKWQDHYEDLKKYPQYAAITARMCLDNTTGFPNWRSDMPDQSLTFLQAPGSRYSYSGEGFVYLQFIIEKLTGRSLDDLANEIVFSKAGMSRSAYHWKPEFEENYCLGYNNEGKPYEKDKDNEPRSASTLETTVDDYAKFLAALLQGKLIAKKSLGEMFTPQIRIRSVQQFGPLRMKDSTTNDSISLSYGLGWGVLQTPYGRGAFKEGHGDGFQHYSILFPEQGKGILIMSNSDNAESIFRDLLAMAIGDHYTPWYWENYIPYRNAAKN